MSSLTRKISMQYLRKHSHGRVPRFIELSLYLPFNIYTCGIECIEPLPFTLGWHLAMDKIYFYTFDEVRNIKFSRFGPVFRPLPKTNCAIK